MVEDKNTAYSLKRPEPLQQLANYARSRGYSLGLLCNGQYLLGWDLSNPDLPNPILSLSLVEILETFSGLNLFSETSGQLANHQEQALRALYRRFHKSNFVDIQRLIAEIGLDEAQWLQVARSQANNENFDELLIEDLRSAVKLLEDDVYYQLELVLAEYQTYCDVKYSPNGNGHEESMPKILSDLRKRILNHLRVQAISKVDDLLWADEKLVEFAENPHGTITVLANKLLKRLQQAQQETQKPVSPKVVVNQLNLLPTITLMEQKELNIKITPQTQITKLDPNLVECLKQYERLVLDWKAWQAGQALAYDHAIKTIQYFTSWKNLVTRTILQGADEEKLKSEFAKQTAYVYVIRLLMVRICEDKGLINRKFSDGGFKYWQEIFVTQYLDFAQGLSLDYLLEIAYRSAQSVYAHFFSNENLYNWYRMGETLLIKVLHILARVNLAGIDSDIIGMVYGRYILEGKHEQGRYYTPRNVVEYMLDSLDYRSDNPEIRGKKLIDLAGGSGSFLVHAARRLIDSYRNPRTGEIPLEYVPTIIQQVKDSLYCLDINPFACYLAETNLLIQVIDLLKRLKDAGNLANCSIDRFNIYNTDTLLLPKGEDFDTPLLNPLLNAEVSRVTQIKTRSGDFSAGFDFVVGNPPYVRADEPGLEAYRRELEESGKFETLHEKWDLFIPFIELSCKTVSTGGKVGLIVSRGIQTNNYGTKIREYITQYLTVLQIDYFSKVFLFSDAAVSNTIFFIKNLPPDQSVLVKRLLHIQTLEQTRELESLCQIEYGPDVFRQFVTTQLLENTIDLEDICYCTVGMVLNSDENLSKVKFKKDDLLNSMPTNIFTKKYLDGENLTREFSVDQTRYLEWGTQRCPAQIRRVTIPELYDLPKILFGMTSYPTFDRGAIEGDGFYVPDSVRFCVRWDAVIGITRLKTAKRQMYELSKKRQKGLEEGKKVQIYEQAERQAQLALRFDLRYIAALLASSFGKKLLAENNRDENIMTVSADGSTSKSRIYPDDLKEFPVKDISLVQQQPFIELVDQLVQRNWDLYALTQQGYKLTRI
ncbi:class I SAM-dependent DNA methyltransferase [Candidatus Cyanaurora vandensis]|uniref:HsdM family class I SAM-dependent methyltransferase n=1 Tax=Candidatus Cyanaurora vandensis TaxID=2714958 RepID=UPI0025805A92|nr:N-6 DNA methylase [Candidatus Cyanaurora vandensis]